MYDAPVGANASARVALTWSNVAVSPSMTAVDRDPTRTGMRQA